MKRQHDSGSRTGSDGTARAASIAPNSTTETERSHKLSVNVSYDVGQRLKRLAFEQRLSESSIVEIALAMLFGRGDDGELGAILRQRGASLRRKLRN